MLKKFLTTIIVLAATATAWADGWKVDYDTNGCHDATITKSADGTMTLAGAIAEVNGKTKEENGNLVYVQKVIIVAESMTEEEVTALGAITQNHVDLSSAKGMTNFSTLPECVKYVILPDGMTKEQVNAVGPGFDAVVSMSEATKTETKWVYTYNDEEFIYEGTPTTIDGVSKANVTVFVPLTVTDSSYKLGDSDYPGTVFYDSNGNCYGVQNESSDIFSLTKSEGYTYNNGATEYTGKVAESEGKYYGVINNPTEVALELNKPVSWTYDNGKYAHLGEVYNNNTMVFWQGGTEYPLTTETRYTYDNGSKLYPENGLTRTADNKTYGWVGGTQVNLTQKDVLYDTNGNLYTDYVREDNGTIYGAWFYARYQLTQTEGYTYNNNSQLYTAKATRTADGKTYGNTGTSSFNVTLKEDAYTYKPNSWSGKQLFSGLIRKDGETVYGIDKSNASLLYTTETAPWTYDNGKYIYEGEYISGTNGNVGGTFCELQTITATAETPVYTFTINDADHGWGQITYCSTDVIEETDQWGNVTCKLNDGTVVNATKNTSGDFKYYNKPADALNYVYKGTVYTKLDGTGQYACEGGTIVYNVAQAAENVNYYTDSDNKEVVYNGDIYYSQENENERWAKTNSNVTPYTLNKENVYVKDDQTLYTGNVYTEEGKLVGFENGEDVELTYGTIYLKTSDNTLYTGKVYHAQGNAEEYWGGAGTEFVATSAKAWFYTPDGGEETQYKAGVYTTADDKNVGFVGGEEKELTHGEVKYYTKDEQTVIATNNSRISLDGDTYCEGGNAIGLMNKEEGYTANLYTDGEGRSVIYTGKVYGDAIGYIGGTETELAYGDVYKKEDGTIYTGYRSEDNTKGCNNAQPLTTSFTYTYKNPNNEEETVTFTDTHHFTTKEVDYTATVEQKEIEMPTGKVHLTAYVSAPGSLKFALARWKDLGNNTAYSAQVGNVTALTLSGDVNYADIGQNPGNFSISDYGHVTYWDNEQGQNVTPDNSVQGSTNNIMNNQAAMNSNALTYLDLENAVFAVQTDMQFAKVSEKLVTVKLPTHESMTLIPDNAFNNLHYVSDLCIPYNYEVIGSGAFFNTHSLTHIYTTDPNEGTIVENGPNTFTFSANLKEIEGGAPALNGPGSTFFGDNIEDVTDIYVLAETAPLCGASAFAASMTYGNNGFAGDLAHPIGHHNYKNGDKWFVVLHYPSELAGTEEEKKYTDVTRVYTLADETGAVDGRGHSMKWPKHVEFGQAYETALAGKLWDGTTTYDTNYQGWHEIVLTGNSFARDFDPQTENTEFVYRDWLTICVPYDMKKSQLLSLLGVDPTKNANGAEGVIYEYVCERDANGNPVKDAEGNYTFEYKEIKRTNAPLYPDVRALTHVSRSVNSRKMTLHFTKLIEQNEIAALSEGDNNETTVTTHDVAINESHGQGFTKTEQTEDDPVVMKGGHPYLIRAYVPKEWNDQIKNLGMYLMAAASSANHAATELGIGESELPYQYGDCTVQASGVEMYLPCLKHKVHAFDADSNTEINSVVAKDKHESFSYIDTDKDAPILYHFIGTYTETKIPQYAYYIGKTKEGVHKFSRTTKTGANAFTWAPYTAVIIGLSAPNYDAEAFDDKATGTAGSIDNIIVQPGVTGDDLKIYVGEDEKLGTSGARLSLGGFDDSTVTGIVDVNVNSNVNISNNKVYSINGQYMGTSLNNLPKGIYIINGQKKVVK